MYSIFKLLPIFIALIGIVLRVVSTRLENPKDEERYERKLLREKAQEEMLSPLASLITDVIENEMEDSSEQEEDSETGEESVVEKQGEARSDGGESGQAIENAGTTNKTETSNHSDDKKESPLAGLLGKDKTTKISISEAIRQKRLQDEDDDREVVDELQEIQKDISNLGEDLEKAEGLIDSAFESRKRAKHGSVATVISGILTFLTLLLISAIRPSETIVIAASLVIASLPALVTVIYIYKYTNKTNKYESIFAKHNIYIRKERNE